MAHPADRDRLFRTLADETGALLGASAVVALRGAGVLRVRAASHALAHARGETIPAQGSFAGAVLSGAGVRSTPALARDPYAHPAERALAAGPAIGAPLAGAGVLLAVRSPDSPPFGDEELAALAQLAPFAAAALAGAKAFADARVPGAAAALVRAVRHELNNPLTVVAGTVHLMEAALAAGDLPGVARSLRLLREASDRLRDLSDRIGLLERAPGAGFVTEQGGLGIAGA